MNGSSGVMISFNLKSLPVSSGQYADGIVPFGLNIMISRCRGRAGAANPRLGKPIKNGSEAVEMPNCLIKWRRWIAFIPVLIYFPVARANPYMISSIRWQ